MDSSNSESLQSSSDYGESYLKFVENLIISDDITDVLLPPSPAPPPPSPPPPPLQSSSRNPRKRKRASRRPPPTVITTDIYNFKAMVQQFTGLPASPFSSSTTTTRRFDILRYPSDPFSIPRKIGQRLIPSSSSSLLNQYHHTTTTSLNFPDFPIPQNHTFQPILPHEYYHHHQVSTHSSLHDLDSMNPLALQSYHYPTSEDYHQFMMRHEFSEFDRGQTGNGQEIHDHNVASSSSSPFIKDSSGTTTTTTTVDPWIFPPDSNN